MFVEEGDVRPEAFLGQGQEHTRQFQKKLGDLRKGFEMQCFPLKMYVSYESTDPK